MSDVNGGTRSANGAARGRGAGRAKGIRFGRRSRSDRVNRFSVYWWHRLSSLCSDAPQSSTGWKACATYLI